LEDMVMSEDLPTKDILSSYWRPLKESQGTKRFRCARCNGATIQKKKPHGKEKKS
jgi:LSD1 subclass zinc finger protein